MRMSRAQIITRIAEELRDRSHADRAELIALLIVVYGVTRASGFVAEAIGQLVKPTRTARKSRRRR
jgi:hypothetical protein